MRQLMKRQGGAWPSENKVPASQQERGWYSLAGQHVMSRIELYTPRARPQHVLPARVAGVSLLWPAASVLLRLSRLGQPLSKRAVAADGQQRPAEHRLLRGWSGWGAAAARAACCAWRRTWTPSPAAAPPEAPCHGRPPPAGPPPTLQPSCTPPCLCACACAP